jgi:uncharacterized cupin superfamily protein
LGTGKHFHGEEAIYVESGQGFMILDDKRYDFFPGTILHIPYRSPHQLFNTGNVSVGYLSGLAWHLEADVYMGRMEQLRIAAKTIRRSSSQLKNRGGRKTDAFPASKAAREVRGIKTWSHVFSDGAKRQTERL